jgi:hypothetical protein
MAEPAISQEARAAVLYIIERQHAQRIERMTTVELSIIERQRAQQIERMTASGAIDPECEYCQKNIMAYEAPASVMAPRHNASPRCESGGHPHCTCDTCF